MLLLPFDAFSFMLLLQWQGLYSYLGFTFNVKYINKPLFQHFLRDDLMRIHETIVLLEEDWIHSHDILSIIPKKKKKELIVFLLLW